MTKKELINAVAAQSGLTKKDSSLALDTILDVLTEAMASGEKVNIVGFGSFEAKQREERKSINPFTKEEMVTPATKVPKFTASKTLKQAINK